MPDLRKACQRDHGGPSFANDGDTEDINSASVSITPKLLGVESVRTLETLQQTALAWGRLVVTIDGEPPAERHGRSNAGRF